MIESRNDTPKDVLRQSFIEITEVCDGYKRMIGEQNRAMVKMSNEFLQQIEQMARTFHAQLASVEQGIFVPVNAYPVSQQPVFTPANKIEKTLKKRKFFDSTDDSLADGEDNDSSLEQRLKDWRRT